MGIIAITSPEIGGNFETGLLYFIGFNFELGMSPSEMSRWLSALAF